MVFYKIWKKYNKIQLTKIKMDLNNRKMTKHPPFLVMTSYFTIFINVYLYVFLCSNHVNCFRYVHGITSFGEGCGRRGKFGIYARVSNYRIWIDDMMSAHAQRELTGRRHRTSRHSRRYTRGGRKKR